MFGQADFRAMFQKAKPPVAAAASNAGGAQSYETAMAAAGGDPAKITGLVMPKQPLIPAGECVMTTRRLDTDCWVKARVARKLAWRGWPRDAGCLTATYE